LDRIGAFFFLLSVSLARPTMSWCAKSYDSTVRPKRMLATPCSVPIDSSLTHFYNFIVVSRWFSPSLLLSLTEKSVVQEVSSHEVITVSTQTVAGHSSVPIVANTLLLFYCCLVGFRRHCHCQVLVPESDRRVLPLCSSLSKSRLTWCRVATRYCKSPYRCHYSSPLRADRHSYTSSLCLCSLF
jgi:hypothetical protein